MEAYEIIKKKQDAGDELDRLAMQLRDSENLSYAASFKMICARNPGLFNLYQFGTEEKPERRP